MKTHPIIEQDMGLIAAQPLPWSNLAGKVVLITGASGFLPAYMVELILWLNENINKENPTKIIGLVRNRQKAIERFAAHQNRGDLTLKVQDVCDPLEVEGGVDFVIHAASQASPKYYGTDPVGTLSANIFGTHQLLEFARLKNCQKFMFFSSGEVYGAAPEGFTRENDYGYLDPLDVRSCYAESKRMGENMAVCWQHQFGVPVVIVRPFHTYGPGMDLFDGRVFADFVSDIVAGRNIVMKSEGTAVRAFCYLADAIAGFFTVLFKGISGQAYNIGNSNGETSIFDLAELLASLFPERRLKVEKFTQLNGNAYLTSPVNRICPDISKAIDLGWMPTISLTEGFTKTIRSFEPWE